MADENIKNTVDYDKSKQAFATKQCSIVMYKSFRHQVSYSGFTSNDLGHRAVTFQDDI